MIEETAKEGPFHLFDNVLKLNSAETADHDLQYVSALRKAYPEMVVTVIPARNVPLRAFAAAGFATCEVDKDTDSYASWRGYVPPPLRSKKGSLGEAVDFAKFHYKWNDEHFILYTVGSVQYILKERRGGEHALGPSKATDAIIQTIGDYISSMSCIQSDTELQFREEANICVQRHHRCRMGVRQLLDSVQSTVARSAEVNLGQSHP